MIEKEWNTQDRFEKQILVGQQELEKERKGWNHRDKDSLEGWETQIETITKEEVVLRSRRHIAKHCRRKDQEVRRHRDNH